ncbi:unnamed protein product [Soboliphyme baturini]|uniref:Transposase n=1 Tax=Soboliphyme baturini TaxID=241478 RepID=A0A183ISI9_9BILA|nr:unnamed protein product [Soboliphyme baturini]
MLFQPQLPGLTPVLTIDFAQLALFPYRLSSPSDSRVDIQLGVVRLLAQIDAWKQAVTAIAASQQWEKRNKVCAAWDL